MADANKNSKWFQWFMIFLLAVVVAISLGLIVYYFVQNDETIRFKNSLLKVNADEEIVVEIEHKDARKGTTIELESYDDKVLTYNKEKSTQTRWVFNAIAGGETEVVLKTNSSNYKSKPTQTCKLNIGNGDVESPYFVSTAQDVQKINERGVDKWYIQTQDIDLGVINGWTPVGGAIGFSGNYNGAGYTLFNLTSSHAEGLNTADGLFSMIAKGGVVTNFTMKDANINTAATYAGVVAGFNSGTISKINIVSSSVVSTTNSAATYVGAVTGAMRYYNSVAGIVRIEQVTVDSATTVGTANATQFAYIGGICGAIESGTIVNSYSKATLTTTERTIAGGLVGCMATEAGATSTAQKANIANSYTVPTFSGTAVVQAGVVGEVLNANISDCRFDGVYYVSDQVSAWTDGEGANYTESGEDADHHAYNVVLVKKVSTEAAKTRSTYTYITSGGLESAWDFDTVWAIDPAVNAGYPTLRMGDTVQDDIFDPTAAPEDTDIDTQEELQAIKNNVEGTYRLKENAVIPINMDTWQTIQNFNGTIEGNGATLALTSADTTSTMLFDTLKVNAKIENLTITGLDLVSNKTYVGGLAEVNEGTLNNITVKGNIVAKDSVAVGGIVGLNTKLIAKSTAESLKIVARAISGTIKAGGIAGENRGTINECEVKDTTQINEHSANSGIVIAGGISGYATESSVISNAKSSATITLSDNNDSVAGGIVGLNEDRAVITKAQVLKGTIKASMVGGLVGRNNGEDTNEFVSIEKSQVNSGVTLTGANAGGLVGDLVRGVVENSATFASLSAKIMAGFAVEVQGSTGANGDGKYATIRTSFASVTFDTAAGTAYAETKSVIRGTNFAWYCMLFGESASNPNSFKLAGYINDSAFNNASGGELCGHSEVPVLWTGSDNKGYTESECKKADTFKNIFSTEIWKLVDGQLPTIKFN